MLTRELLANTIDVVIKAGYGTCPLVEQRMEVTFAQAFQLLVALERAGVLDPPKTTLNRRELRTRDNRMAMTMVDAAITVGRIQVEPGTNPQADTPPTPDLVFAQALTRLDYRAAADAFVAFHTQSPEEAAMLLQLALTATSAAGQGYRARGGGRG